MANIFNQNKDDKQISRKTLERFSKENKIGSYVQPPYKHFNINKNKTKLKAKLKLNNILEALKQDYHFVFLDECSLSAKPLKRAIWFPK